MSHKKPHVLGIDDAPFDKDRDSTVQIVGVIMEAADVVEGVAITTFPVDGPDASAYLAEWVRELKWSPTLDLIVLGGITIAGLGLIDLEHLSKAAGSPAAATTRRDTSTSRLNKALRAAGLQERMSIAARTPEARFVTDGLFVASAGAPAEEVDRMVRASLGKSRLPEALRVAHLIGAAASTGSSRGRV